MKKNIILILVILLTYSCKKNSETNDFNFHSNGVIAHRGAWKNTGESQNSLGSLRKAIELGCHGSEFDVHLTADDSLIVYHNLHHHGMIIDSTNYKDLVKFPLSNGEKIPTLREYLNEGMKQKNTKLIIDIKTPKNANRTVESARKILAVVEELGAQEWVEYLGGHLPTLLQLKEQTNSPVAYLGRWQKETPQMHPDSILKMGFKYVDYEDIHYKNNIEWLDSFKQNSIHLNVWTVNKEEDMQFFRNKGFDYITTDEPEKLLKLITNEKRN